MVDKQAIARTERPPETGQQPAPPPDFAAFFRAEYRTLMVVVMSVGATFGEADEAEVEKELEEEEKQAEVKKKLGKKMKKALQKREKNYLYDSDSSHPYSTSVYADQHRKKG